MKRIFLLLAVLIVVGAGVGWIVRGTIRDQTYALQQPTLPQPKVYANEVKPVIATPTSTKKNVAPVVKPVVDPFVWSGELPASINLAVPFLLQAPKSNWSLPYQEACEEAVLLMVDGFYKGKTTRFGKEEGDKAILDLVAFEKDLLGEYEDTTAEETKQLFEANMRYGKAYVRSVKTADEIKRVLANGYPVIVPAAGKLLKNPYFRNGGPLYHMVVIKGYLEDGRWIVNDPGIGRGADYVYAKDVLMNAIHDWNDGNVTEGEKVMLVITP